MGCKPTLLQQHWKNVTCSLVSPSSPKPACTAAEVLPCPTLCFIHVQARNCNYLPLSYCSQSIKSFCWGTCKLETGGSKELSTDCTATAIPILLSEWLQNWKLHPSPCTCTWHCLRIWLLQENSLSFIKGNNLTTYCPHFAVWFHKWGFRASFRKACCQHIANKVVAHYTCAILKYTAEYAKFPYLAKQTICFQDLWPSIFRPNHPSYPTWSTVLKHINLDFCSSIFI